MSRMILLATLFSLTFFGQSFAGSASSPVIADEEIQKQFCKTLNQFTTFAAPPQSSCVDPNGDLNLDNLHQWKQDYLTYFGQKQQLIPYGDSTKPKFRKYKYILVEDVLAGETKFSSEDQAKFLMDVAFASCNQLSAKFGKALNLECIRVTRLEFRAELRKKHLSEVGFILSSESIYEKRLSEEIALSQKVTHEI